MDQGLVEQFTWVILNSEVNVVNELSWFLFALLYFVAGQSIAHPIFLSAVEEGRATVGFRNRLGLMYGFFWPIVAPWYIISASRRLRAEEEAGKKQEGKGDDARNGGSGGEHEGIDRR